MCPKYRIVVIIPACTCPRQQIASVINQLEPEDHLVVVLNGMTEEERNKCRRPSNPLITWLDVGPAVGAGCARNLGVNALNRSAELFLFCDADDQVAPTWLKELARPLLDRSADLVGGALRVKLHSNTQTLVVPSVDYWYGQAVFGANLGITYEAWYKLYGFNQSLMCCEDTDLAWRAMELGLKVQIVPSAIVDYNLRVPIQELRQRFRWGQSSVHLLLEHGLELDRLPIFWTIYRDKKTTGFASVPAIAAFGQWAGQWIGRWQRVFCRRYSSALGNMQNN